MLILNRKLDESIMIGDDVEIKVIKVQGNQVLLGIKAPKNVSIYRHEIYEQVKNENLNAVQRDLNLDSISNLGDHLSQFRNLLSAPKKQDKEE